MEPCAGAPLHHPMELHSSLLKQAAWRAKLSHRCAVCWLRKYDCYCSAMAGGVASISAPAVLAEVVVYYHYSELGRSPNTAHVLSIAAPHLVTRCLTFGDVQQERELLDILQAERASGEDRTCIMYPSHDAIDIRQWYDTRKSAAPARIILLDGTYSQSTKQLKFILNHFDNVVPIVKLDLGRGCRSAIAGIMAQPAVDKICSYQAVVLALQQIGADAGYCAHLLAELDKWLAYILRRKIRFGKRNTILVMKDEENHAFSQFIEEHLRKNPPPVGHTIGRKQKKYVNVVDSVTPSRVAPSRVVSGGIGVTNLLAIEPTKRFSAYIMKKNR